MIFIFHLVKIICSIRQTCNHACVKYNCQSQGGIDSFFSVIDHKSFSVIDHKSFSVIDQKSFSVIDPKSFSVIDHKSFSVIDHKSFSVIDHKSMVIDIDTVTTNRTDVNSCRNAHEQ